MKFLLLLAGWATLAFIPSWLVSHGYQQGLAQVAGRIVAPPGTEIEFQQLELFYPFDLGVYVALCLASVWAGWERRLRALIFGLPVLIALELLSLTVAMKVMMGVMANPSATDLAVDQAVRLANAVIRVTGLVAAAAVWFYLLGRERLSLATRTWLGA
jgi:hypothetical protein